MGAREEIARRRADFVTAFNGEDFASLEQLCTDDIVMLPPNQPPIAGIRDALEWWSVGFQAGRTTVTIVPRELYIAEGWAMDWFDWSATIVPITGMYPSSMLEVRSGCGAFEIGTAGEFFARCGKAVAIRRRSGQAGLAISSWMVLG